MFPLQIYFIAAAGDVAKNSSSCNAAMYKSSELSFSQKLDVSDLKIANCIDKKPNLFR